MGECLGAEHVALQGQVFEGELFGGWEKLDIGISEVRVNDADVINQWVVFYCLPYNPGQFLTKMHSLKDQRPQAVPDTLHIEYFP